MATDSRILVHSLIDFLSLGVIAIVAVVVSFASIQFSRIGIQKALRSEVKTNAVEKIFETMGFKNFKASDLNTGKLDDTGFTRFRQLLYDIGAIYGQSASPKTNSIIEQLKALQQFAPQKPQEAKPQDNSGGVPA